VDWEKNRTKFHEESEFKYYFRGVHLDICYGWGKDIHAPCDGKIVKVKDGYKEKHKVHFIRDIIAVLKNSVMFNPEKTDIQSIVGNYIIMECGENVFAFFAHFQEDSITVSQDEEVKKGQILGKVGHSGNSTAPHLHFHIMDNIDLLKTKGIPCVFEKYEILQDDHWQTIKNGVPSEKDIIKFNI
jgi:murein DD-endopeptidase MepM/ murein hydrolase activator NlpD